MFRLNELYHLFVKTLAETRSNMQRAYLHAPTGWPVWYWQGKGTLFGTDEDGAETYGPDVTAPLEAYGVHHSSPRHFFSGPEVCLLPGDSGDADCLKALRVDRLQFLLGLPCFFLPAVGCIPTPIWWCWLAPPSGECDLFSYTLSFLLLWPCRLGSFVLLQGSLLVILFGHHSWGWCDDSC